MREPIRAPETSNWSLAWTSGDALPPASHRELISTIRRCLETSGKRVLEVGAGTGSDSIELSTLGTDAYALDFTLEALTLVRQLSKEHEAPVRLVCGDTLHLPFKTGSFDVVFSQGLLEHFSHPLAVVEEQSRLLRKGGYLLIDVPQKFSLYTLHKHKLMRRNAWFASWETEYSLLQLDRLLRSAGLRSVRSYGHGYYPPVLLGIRNLHTLDLRRNMSFRLPGKVRDGVELIWQKLESSRWFHRWLNNIGVVARKA